MQRGVPVSTACACTRDQVAPITMLGLLGLLGLSFGEAC